MLKAVIAKPDLACGPKDGRTLVYGNSLRSESSRGCGLLPMAVSSYRYQASGRSIPCGAKWWTATAAG